ncbi:MAG: hypothetical protein QOD56_1929, partial [Gammaproteobacteria bacterium]|nr:hypothetical protein [Gammaproteobacteria bacterium]
WPHVVPGTLPNIRSPHPEVLARLGEPVQIDCVDLQT